MLPTLPIIVVFTATALAMSGAPATGKKANAKPETNLAEQLSADRERVHQALQLPSPYVEAQRRVTEGPQPAWWQSDAGLSETVPPPWTPVSVEGPLVKVWGRNYRLAESGLPQAIDSDSTTLLAGPVRLVAAVDGHPVDVQGGKLRVDSANDREVRLSSRSQLGSFSLGLSIAVEYDGFARFDAIVSGAPRASLDQLILEIPLRTDCATYYAHDMQGVRPVTKANGDLLFDSGGHGGALPPQGLTLTFTPQIILANGRVGLSFVTASEQGWSVADRQRMIEVVRREGAAVLRVHFVDQPTRLAQPLRLNWAVTALPSRPRPTWRAYETFNSAQWGSAAGFLSAALRKGPSDTETALDRAARDGLKVVIMHQEWTEMQGYPGTLREDNANNLRRAVDEAHRRHLKVVAYLGQEVSQSFPEWERFGGAMVRMPLQGGRGRTDPQALAWRPCGNAVYADFLVYKTRELIRQFDIDGIFLDGHPAITPCLNTEHGHGYQAETGEWRATFDVYDIRRMHQRLYALFHGAGKSDGVLCLHSGWGWTPAFSFGDYRLAGEFEVYHHKMHPELNLMQILPPDYFRAVYDPAINGLPLAWMSKPDKGGLSFAQDRAVSLLHGVMQRASWPMSVSDGPARDGRERDSDGGGLGTAWKIWQIFGQFNPDTARWCDYADTASPLRAQPGAIKVSGYARTGDGVLAVVSNLGLSPEKAVVAFDLHALQLNANGIAARDAMTNEPLALDGGNLSLSLKPESCRLVLIRKQP